MVTIHMVQIAKLVALDRGVDTLLRCTQKLLHRDGQDTLFDAEFVVVAVGIVVPNMHTIIYEVLDVGVARKEPQQLVDNALQKDLLGRKQRKSLGEVKAHLVTKNRLCARSRAVGLDYALVLNSGKEVEILFHNFSY